MRQNRQSWTGWTLVGLPILFHTVFELIWKASLRGVPEVLVDTVCISSMMAGLFLLVPRFELKLARWCKR